MRCVYVFPSDGDRVLISVFFGSTISYDFDRTLHINHKSPEIQCAAAAAAEMHTHTDFDHKAKRLLLVFLFGNHKTI